MIEGPALFNTASEMDRALRNCYMLANRHKGEGDWAHIIRFCEEIGYRRSPLRAAGENGEKTV